MYWHLRQHLSGIEMEHGAVLRHDGQATRIGRAVGDAVTATRDVSPRQNTRRFALIFDFHQHWAQETRPQPGTEWNYRVSLEQDWYGAISDTLGEPVVGSFEECLKVSRIVFAPHFQMARTDHIEMIEAFLLRGGRFVTTADFGRLDWENNVRAARPLGLLNSITAMADGEILHLKPDFTVTGNFDGKQLLGRRFWFRPTGPDWIGLLTGGGLTGPAFFESASAAGRVFVLTTAFDRSSLAHLLASIVERRVSTE